MLNVDQQEIAKFAKLAATWWDPQGDLKTLHHINPVRLAFIEQLAPLAGKKVIDIGCGGGILTEALAKRAGDVTGIDMNVEALQIAEQHAKQHSLSIHYQCITAENMVMLHPRAYDTVVCMELLEHVPEPASIVQACAKLVKPGGDVFFSTINRNLKAYLLAVVSAEYLLKLLPKGTHDYAKFIRPAELAAWVREAGMVVKDMKGLYYNPITQSCKLTSDINVNYLIHCQPH
jgi:2-polyprenyl-6-hydroxyphenyl methylase/3-demethylubiquinone-9 3-methyltransferase